MSKPLTQIGKEVREMTDAEYAQWQTDNEAHAIEAAAVETQAVARASAITKLADLGLTDDEISALVG
jgi:D-alanyl-D-alanine carboxypeptidase